MCLQNVKNSLRLAFGIFLLKLGIFQFKQWQWKSIYHLSLFNCFKLKNQFLLNWFLNASMNPKYHSAKTKFCMGYIKKFYIKRHHRVLQCKPSAKNAEKIGYNRWAYQMHTIIGTTHSYGTHKATEKTHSSPSTAPLISLLSPSSPSLLVHCYWVISNFLHRLSPKNLLTLVPCVCEELQDVYYFSYSY